MKRHVVKVPELSSRKEMFAYLRKNADKIIAEKKALPTVSDDLDFGYSLPSNKDFVGRKDTGVEDNPNLGDGELAVDIIANMAGWCDSYMDVMIKDSWKKSINDTGASGMKLIYHLKNHGTGYQYTTDSVIGRNCSIYSKDVELSMFNIQSDIKKAQALMMSSIVCKRYDEKCYHLYKDKEIKQHSIGLQYVRIYLCIYSEEAEDAQYKENWDKYYQFVINKDKVDARGYFWAVVECRILEVSAVLFGANELTPTISVEGKQSTHHEPAETTQGAPHEKFDITAAIQQTQFFNN